MNISDLLFITAALPLLGLATWRQANLVANETGPFYIFRKARLFAKFACQGCTPLGRFCRALHLYELLECEWCNSVWIGTFMLVLFILSPKLAIYYSLPLSLSTITIFLKYNLEKVRYAK